MKIEVVLPGRKVLLLALVAGVAGLLWWAASPADSQEGSAPLASFAFLARADNPVDALAAGALAGQLGGPVYLTGSNSLGPQASQGLAATDPQVVVLAGGVAALSEQVATEVAALLPDAQIRRFAGTDRTETARLLNTLPGELGVGRPLVTGATVTGDVGLDGTLTVAGQDVAATLTALTARIDSLESGLAAANNRATTLETTTATLQSDLASANGRVAALETTLAGVSRSGDVLTFDGMNVQVTNGAGHTASTNGLGNLIVGYNEDHTNFACQPGAAPDCDYRGDEVPDVRTGSHMLVVGVDHSYTSYGGIIAGRNNTTEGFFASVTGGQFNIASGLAASITGGAGNTASGLVASVTGGAGHTASGTAASVSGGSSNEARGNNASVTGGQFNTASAFASTVAGGFVTSITASPTSNNHDSRTGNTLFADG